MKISIAGIGPGSFDMITLSALGEAQSSDIILVPRSRECDEGVAERVIAHHLPEKKIVHMLFPMTNDTKKRSEIIFGQLAKLEAELRSAKKFFFPVIGDSTLYSTGAYLIDEMKKFFPDIEVDFVPGVSAHSLASACAKNFMAMSDEIFSVIPGTATPEKIIAAIEHSDSVAIYKPTSIKDKKIFNFIKASAAKIIRVNFAGIPEKE
ncbi:MAG: hypothetical protein IJU31_07105, partial [Synergistaceae bacterium]|nr:hypothetical protein [Synergistaceae bacterium]